ncbi:MAG: 16S rRNA (guanine(527)-N(7))-methyltransferase RsmG [Synergistales bacterium]|uniref:16S rRNA (guanine(527)-N(7))-methyltransferase RsmG n=1 Tax=Aminivibrio sp. TaxID=1872489 RepID=UPI001D78E427|nr:16S rRNA (guanine(527)-N(7))-methyltransferase RsmG [Synergistaceae bacterium]MDD3391715.1 16S rRNA (guanine(527)-N(7))-methyltransferase RsmG [Synergistaceae bacterium]MDD4021720.1 16S rRNA (guanine(527)-N(7))-methyltransferase RsmG [Synergistaceae bacterium]MDD4613369.1 16S rRNA (guanine(527)-N(7))-methyltransferase RsmG [Synergistaceae bacterium]NCC58507.1 16S rRNA (guanine(527)-N(7))-methyltransferase RsmG [Synergistales bacterium]
MSGSESTSERGSVVEPAVQKLLSFYGDALLRYRDALASYGGKIRLTGPREPEILWREHILDCLCSVPFLPGKGAVIDVGSGGGLPGIVWAICRPDLEVTLLDSVRKKCGALGDMARELGLSNVRVVWSRCEEYALKARESFSFAGARAVASAGVLLEYLSPLVSVGGEILAMKGPLFADELEPLEGKWNRMGVSSPSLVSYDVEGKQLFLVLWKKNAPCPSRFPRKAGMAEKINWWR